MGHICAAIESNLASNYDCSVFGNLNQHADNYTQHKSKVRQEPFEMFYYE